MTFVRLAFFPEATQRHFQKLADVMPLDQRPPGRLLFAAGPVPGGWQVIQVWTSKDLLAAFNRDHFFPALAAVGGAAFPRPPVVTDFEPTVLKFED